LLGPCPAPEHPNPEDRLRPWIEELAASSAVQIQGTYTMGPAPRGPDRRLSILCQQSG